MHANRIVSHGEFVVGPLRGEELPQGVNRRVVVGSVEHTDIVDQDDVLFARMIEDGLQLLKDGRVEVRLGSDSAGVMAVKPEETGGSDFLQEFGKDNAAIALQDVDVGGGAEATAGLLGELGTEFDGI